ncbi:MAG: hypothetical protein ABI042_06855 [Verrucomicrobiota bacterium]
MQNSIRFKKFLLPARFVFGLVLILTTLPTSAAQDENTLYDSDPKHLWNRLNETLFVRTAQDGKKYGSDELDILYWANTKNLLKEPSSHKALAILGEFIKTHGEKLIRNPLQRALLQRDLWELFDWSAEPLGDSNQDQARRELQARLVLVIRQIALTTNEIALLPDNYAKAESTHSLTNLPQGLFQTNGDWVNVGIIHLDPAAVAHVRSFSGRSTFLVMLHHPDGRQAGIDYLKRLRSFKPMWADATNSDSHEHLNPKLPQFPPNTQWGLVRRMSVIDTEGQIQPTRIIESIQVRTYLKIPTTNNLSISGTILQESLQRFQEFQMSQKSDTALAAIPEGKKGFNSVHFFSKGIDPFETKHDFANFRGEALEACAGCHSFGPGIHSVNTFSRIFLGDQALRTTQLTDSKAEPEFWVTREWKQRQFDWGLLQGFWHRENEAKP